MTTDAASNELDALRALVIRLTSERDAALAENDQLRYLLKQLQRAQFGRRSDRKSTRLNSSHEIPSRMPSSA